MKFTPTTGSANNPQMSAITYLKCPACGKTHSLFVSGEDSFSLGVSYEFLCPERRKVAKFVANKATESHTVRSRRRGTLAVTKSR